MAERVNSNKIHDIAWSLSRTNDHVKVVNTKVKNFEGRLVSVEEDVGMIEVLAEKILKLQKILLTLTKETNEKKFYDTAYRMYEREYSPDSDLGPEKRRRMIEAKMEEIYQDIDSYTKWLKWKKMQEENGERLKWSEWVENEVRNKKDTSYLLRE